MEPSVTRDWKLHEVCAAERSNSVLEHFLFSLKATLAYALEKEDSFTHQRKRGNLRMKSYTTWMDGFNNHLDEVHTTLQAPTQP